MVEVCPFKLKRSLLIGSIYRPPSYTKADDLSLEANLERVYLLDKETIFLGNVNIDGRNKKSFDKHRLINAVDGMNFTHLVNEVTRSVSGTCLDHIYSNHPQRILNISTLTVASLIACLFLLYANITTTVHLVAWRKSEY